MKVRAVGGLIAFLASMPVFAQCVAPQAPSHFPSGATATREDMLAALHAIREYEAAVVEFSKCARQSNNEAQMQIADRAVDAVKILADKFNAELYAFKKRNDT